MGHNKIKTLTNRTKQKLIEYWGGLMGGTGYKNKNNEARNGWRGKKLAEIGGCTSTLEDI